MTELYAFLVHALERMLGYGYDSSCSGTGPQSLENTYNMHLPPDHLKWRR